MTQQPEIRVGILGATGYIGSQYRRELRESSNVAVVALCARRRELLEQAGEEDNADLLTDRWQAVLERSDINFVIVATPDAFHYESVMACAKAGKNILCEKPIGKNRREANEMWNAFRHSQLGNFVPFWTRFAPPFRKVKEIVDSGRLGTIQGIFYRWHNPRPPETPLTWRDNASLSTGGSIGDVGSHAYDTVRWLVGDEATRVLVHARTLSSDKPDFGDLNLREAMEQGSQLSSEPLERKLASTPDFATIAWEFGGGAVGALVVSHASHIRKGICPELELHGSKASLAINRMTGDITLCDDGKLETVANVPDVPCNRFESYVLPIIRAHIEKTPPPSHPNLFDGYRVQCFLDAAIASAETATWQSISEDR